MTGIIDIYNIVNESVYFQIAKFIIGWVFKIKFILTWILYMDMELSVHTTTEIIIIGTQLYMVFTADSGNKYCKYVGYMQYTKSAIKYSSIGTDVVLYVYNYIY